MAVRGEGDRNNGVPNNPEPESPLAKYSQQAFQMYTVAEEYGVIDFITHPFACADTLCRLGYEPFPPVEQRSVWGFIPTSYLAIPGLVPYGRYLLFSDGPNLYRSFVPLLARKLSSQRLFKYLDENLPLPSEPVGGRSPELYEAFTNENVTQFIKMRVRSLIARMAVTFITQPLTVITVRCMASLAGQEDGYRSALGCILSTLKHDGIRGFFSGVTPRLVGDIVFVSSSSILFLSMMRSMQNVSPQMDQRSIELMNNASLLASNHVGNAYSGQFRNISDIMTINGNEQIALGNPPFTGIYDGWFDCWANIRHDRLFKSMSYLSFTRVYDGPQTFQDGHIIPLEKFGPLYMPKSGVKMPYLLTDYYSAVLSDAFMRKNLIDIGQMKNGNGRTNKPISSEHVVDVHS